MELIVNIFVCNKNVMRFNNFVSFIDYLSFKSSFTIVNRK